MAVLSQGLGVQSRRAQVPPATERSERPREHRSTLPDPPKSTRTLPKVQLVSGTQALNFSLLMAKHAVPFEMKQ